MLSTTGASTNTLNQQRQQTLVRGRGGMCVTHRPSRAPPAETSENGVSQCAMIRTGPALAVIARRRRAENSWWYLRARCEISRDVNIPT